MYRASSQGRNADVTGKVASGGGEVGWGKPGLDILFVLSRELLLSWGDCAFWLGINPVHLDRSGRAWASLPFY